MNLLLKIIAGHVVRRVATDPQFHRKVSGAANKAASEIRKVNNSEDSARAAGQTVRRALDKLWFRNG